MEFYATCAAGFEQLLADELTSLGIGRVRPLRGQVAFEGTLASGYRACLWSRIASRVVAVIARVDARDAERLYEGLVQIGWEEQLPQGATFAIDAHGTNQQLRNTQFTALRCRDAINDRMLARSGTRPVATGTNPDLRIALRITRERASVGVDLVGEPLFRRGYEQAGGGGRTGGGRQAAPSLRSDYAAALLALGGWGELCAGERPALVVPSSGSDTLAVEAAMICARRAPGLLRMRWGCVAWAQHDAAAWDELLASAREQATQADGLQLLLPDGQKTGVRRGLRAAGLELEPSFSPTPQPKDGSSCLLACDFSRIRDDAVAHKADAVTTLATVAAALPEGTRAIVFATDALSDMVLGDPEQVLQTIVGSSDASMRSYTLSGTTQLRQARLPGGEQVRVLVPGSEQFAARLAKVYRQRRKWARREDVSCYRIYDADLPDYAVSIDLFEGSETPGRWLQIFEYAPPKSVDATLAQARLLDVAAIAPRVLGVSPADTFVRVRTRARGGSQYADESREPRGARPGRTRAGRPTLPPGAQLVDEGGLTFEVNFSTRLDCGIFLDHRDTRAMLREMAKQTRGSKRFLNLFAYTGTASCYAADGGATFTTTVDLSRPSLDWARRNMERNGFSGSEHEFVQADVLSWVSEQRHSRNRWDLVFCDVPTFSNSSRMRKASFDVQRDHVELLIGVSRLLTREGTCVFSCNLRTFKLDEQALARAGVVATDITDQTIPEDFSRNPRIHKCYLVRREARG